MTNGHNPTPVSSGLISRQWATIGTTRTALLIAHNITTLSRLLDVLDIFDSDARIQIVFSATESDPFRHELVDELEKIGIITIPWAVAKNAEFDLAITASHHDKVTELFSPLVILSHGIGYTKYSPTRNQEPGTRNQEPGTRNQEPGTRNQVFGLSPEWVLRQGKPAARALVLSHDDQVAMLAAAAPAAVPAAVVAGDPCFDRIVASLPFRERYRAALGIADRILVYVSSTWSDESTLGARFDLLRSLLAELPRDSYVVATALHPNISHHHGPGLIRRWLADCMRSGLIILPEIDDWRSGLIAADLIIGDNGSVTGYGAAIGRPTLLCAFPDVPDGTPVSELGRLAGRLPATGPLRKCIDKAIADHRPRYFDSVTDLVTSAPGQAHDRLRALCYEILDLAPPPTETPARVLPAPTPHSTSAIFADEVTARSRLDTRLVQLVRRPAEIQRHGAWRPGLADGHLCSTIDYPMLSIRTRADVLIARSSDAGHDIWTTLLNILRDNPFCTIAAIVDGHRCRVAGRSGERVEMVTDGPADVLPSAVYAWAGDGRTLASMAPGITVELATSRWRVRVECR
ncbi:hypothetical protein NONO_c35560 [Nocardia nova SH22a]|uniref:Uncharacterized protein n=1 Tax=Nocardia nova SH22a TaxID=1415166 RepID=W5TH76_9NOCA|nr:hypothetical protein [Nocardia nova]AHH18343.1 hypothetical protein NONO_c35560 [Nocardia nova SH22a]